MSSDQAPVGFIARRSGLVVPAHVGAAAGAPRGQVAALDPDGRRRVVIVADEARVIRRALQLLERHGFTMLLRCQDRQRPPRVGAPPACEQLLQPEDLHTPDHGFGCACSRIHLGR